MYSREIATEIHAMAQQYPIVTVVGPRQAGKTKITRHLFSQKPYVNLEKLQEREFAQSDPVAFLEQYPEGVILDEIQRVPELLSYLQADVDEDPRPGKFILTGSHQLKLHEAISQSLAGRTAILKMLPMSMSELIQNNISYTDNEYILKGGYPKVHQTGIDVTKYYNFYCQTDLDRDVRQIINVKDLTQFQRFMRLCAARVGTAINASELACELGLTAVTVKQWLSVLEASYLIFFIPPYFKNYGKRVIKTPRLYFTDVGLATYLLAIESDQQIIHDPSRGRLFENLVILEMLKARYNKGLEPNLYYYRDSAQFEVDILYQKGHQVVAVEIKSGKTFRREAVKNLLTFKGMLQDEIESTYLIYAGAHSQKVQGMSVLNYQDARQVVSS